MLVAGAQVIQGTIFGCRFTGIGARTLVPAFGPSLCATGLMLGLAALVAQVMALATDTTRVQALLALAPGGLSEIALIAVAVLADASRVALHHVARIIFVIVLGPVGFRLLHRRRQEPIP